MSSIYATNRDAIEQVIVPSIEGTGEAKATDYDVQAIFERAFIWTGRGYEQTVDEDGFWEIVKAAEVAQNAEAVADQLVAEGYDRSDVLAAIDSFLAVDWTETWTAEDVQVLRDQLGSAR